MATESEVKKRARAATLGAPTGSFKTIGIWIGDQLFAVREPTVREHGEIMKSASEALASGKSDINISKLRVAAVIKCTCVGEQLKDGDGNPMTETVPLLDTHGKPLLDENGQPKTTTRPMVKAGERVFDDADTAALLDQPVSSFIDQLASPAMTLVNAKTEDARKSS